MAGTHRHFFFRRIGVREVEELMHGAAPLSKLIVGGLGFGILNDAPQILIELRKFLLIKAIKHIGHSVVIVAHSVQSLTTLTRERNADLARP